MTTVDPSENQPIGKPGPKPGPRDWSKSPVASRRCHAHKKTGEQCKNAALAGQSVCKYHGGAAPQSINKARERLSAAADRMAERLLGIAESENIPAYVALQAVNSVLDRVGVVEPKQVDITVRPFEQLLEDVTGGSRDAYRRAIGDERAGEIFSIEAEPHHHGGPPTEPSGVRIIGETSDGHSVIDGELADDDQERRTHPAGERVPTDADHVGRDTLVNLVVPVKPVRGYLPGDLAMEQAAEANRNHRAQLRRR